MNINISLKGNALHLLWVALPIFFASCQSDNAPAPEPEPESTAVFVEQLEERTITFDEILDHEKENFGISDEDLKSYSGRLQMLRILTKRCTAHAISYHTITPQGTPTVASGVVYVPKTDNIRGVIEISPINKAKDYCASKYMYTFEATPALLGYICIIPDLIGCGKTSNLPISYMQHDNVARVGADMRKASEEFLLNRYNLNLSKESMLFGYSLGGSGAWALARFYQLHPERDVNITEIFVGGGAYTPTKALDSFIASSHSEYAIMPNIIWSINYYDNLNLDFSKVFKGELLDHYEEWCEGTMSVPQLTKMLGKEISSYINFDFFNNNNADYLRLRKALDNKTIPNDWVPKAKVHLYHSSNDTYVPTECGDELYKYLQSVNADVTYKKFDEGHVYTGILVGLDAFKQIGF